MALTLATDERTELERRVRSLKIRAEDARRALVILKLADWASYSTIEATVPCYRDYISRWRRRTPGPPPSLSRFLGSPWSCVCSVNSRSLSHHSSRPRDLRDDGGFARVPESVLSVRFLNVSAKEAR